ncbi:MAG: hypothetical protein CO012_01645 [Syntrophobacterales bacterium CG_4_8_14_3_um_filter_49_14]|nr:MAG: hypothetical protein COX52_09385 [Syntrophobacterales bacterium CG23_combo_of_CG06-09_8_20_14_all_48_27]PJC76110.1 MAG: hypothetical protein CO012_01645 [Syntrophobacterales bacterium CG_4_8_14_3_um_filter_49_14]
MRNIIRTKNFYLMLLLDSFFVTLSYFLAYFIRFEGNLPYQEWVNFRTTIPYILLFNLISRQIYNDEKYIYIK